MNQNKLVEGRTIYLVGSIPLQNAREVFETVSSVLGERIAALPDGETGERRHWLGWLEGVFASHPHFEKTSEAHQIHSTAFRHSRYRLKNGIDPNFLQFDNLPIAAVALQSYETFAALKKAGRIPDRMRFQVAIASPLSVAHAWSADECRSTVERAYEAALLGEIKKLAAAIPHDQLTIQWDLASPIFLFLERGEPTRYGHSRQDMMTSFTQLAIRLGDAVLRDIDLYFHLCYGDSNHRHSIEPRDMSNLVDFANLVSSGIGRPIQLFHMPVPRDRSDDGYFAPLARLKLQAGTNVSLGLIHFTDGLRGTERRMGVARNHLDTFWIATECGFGRRPPETIPALLQLHAEAADLR